MTYLHMLSQLVQLLSILPLVFVRCLHPFHSNIDETMKIRLQLGQIGNQGYGKVRFVQNDVKIDHIGHVADVDANDEEILIRE